MGELEEKLNAILGDQAAMGQIMALAQSLSKPAPPPPAEEAAPEGTEGAGPEGPGAARPPGDLLRALDPGMLQLGARLWQEYQGGDQRSAALLEALRPFLREKRRARLDRAVQIARLSHVIRVALQILGEREGEDHV